jgi:hypothetical protein
MSNCDVLKKYIEDCKRSLGYFPGYQQCLTFLQKSGMSQEEISKCIEMNLKKTYNDADISMGVF